MANEICNTCTGSWDTSYLSDWSSGVWTYALGSPTAISAISLSGWAVSQFNVGKLNTMLQECHCVSSGVVCPPYNVDELGFLEKLYMVGYFNGLARTAVGGNNVVSTADGDGKISITNTAAISKNFFEAAKEANLEANYIASAYRSNDNLSRDVSYYYILWNNGNGANYWGAQGYIG